MGVRLIEPPQKEPVSLEEAKRHLRVEHQEDDDYIEGLITAAREAAEMETGAALVVSTWEHILDGFPVATAHNPRRAIELHKHPVQSVESLEYLDTDGQTQSLSLSEDCQVVVEGELGLGYVYPAYGYTWPQAQGSPGSVRVQFKAGWPLDADEAPTTPQAIKQWILLGVGALYENREAVYTGRYVHDALKGFLGGLLDRYRVLRW